MTTERKLQKIAANLDDMRPTFVTGTSARPSTSATAGISRSSFAPFMTWQGIWPNTIAQGQAIIDGYRGPTGQAPTLWSTYAGLIESKNNLMHPSFDYIIHAIGPENRASYLARFVSDKPRLVQTVLPSYNAHEIFIEQTSWDFYRELLQNYRVTGATPWSVYWVRSDSAVSLPPST